MGIDHRRPPRLGPRASELRPRPRAGAAMTSARGVPLDGGARWPWLSGGSSNRTRGGAPTTANGRAARTRTARAGGRPVPGRARRYVTTAAAVT